MNPARHYGMDWLRIGAFAILILYHIGMVFVPWPYHFDAPHHLGWTTVPMLLPSAWRLMLLFLVSGFASRVLMAKHPDARAFAIGRTKRLLVPLLFGMAIIVPPQAWVELVSKHGYDRSYLQFWLTDYFAFAKRDGIMLPTWNHLWFVAYLLVYTLGIAAFAAVIRPKVFQHAFDRLFGGVGLVFIPLAWLLALRLWWIPGLGETHAFVDDWAAHLQYLPAFLFGFGLGRSEHAFAAIRRWWIPCAVVALLSYAFVGGFQAMYLPPKPAPEPIMPWFRGARSVQAWTTIIALIGFADRYLNRDHRWRATLTEAVFPFYIIHQTIIVVLAWWLFELGASPALAFALLVVGTVAGCWAFYLGGREIRPLRPLIGLRLIPPAPRHAAPAAPVI